MGESDFGLTPNVWRPSEVPYPGVGSDTVQQAQAPLIVTADQIIKAWGKVTVSPFTLDAAFNVASVTHTGAGSFTITWPSSLSSVNYLVLVTPIAGTGLEPMVLAGQTQTTVSLQFNNTLNATQDPTGFFFIMLGG